MTYTRFCNRFITRFDEFRIRKTKAQTATFYYPFIVKNKQKRKKIEIKVFLNIKSCTKGNKNIHLKNKKKINPQKLNS